MNSENITPACVNCHQKGKTLAIGGGNDLDGAVSFCAGVSVPQALIDELAAAPKGKALATGIEIAGRAIRQIKEENLCDGVHIPEY